MWKGKSDLYFHGALQNLLISYTYIPYYYFEDIVAGNSILLCFRNILWHLKDKYLRKTLCF